MVDKFRCMPKRPCSILVSPDNKSILCGDKFGDVYSLPLLPSVSDEPTIQDEQANPQETASVKSFTPTATNLTVHSGRNRRALESQLRQKGLQAKSKEPLKFEHQLLLGHVSMLTDVQIATYTADGKPRELIITSDRDEHIRVSRGPPQAYVIERYCLGHQEFISKLCLLPRTTRLVSGGGDDWLGFWDFVSGELLDKCNLKTAMSELPKKDDQAVEGDSEAKIAVSGLWATDVPETEETLLLAASERVPAIFAVLASTVGSGKVEAKAIALPGNPLDVATNGSTLIISLDTAKVGLLFKPFVYSLLLTGVKSNSPRILAYKMRITDSRAELVLDDEYNGRLQQVNELTAASAPSEDLLYGIENLRKRGFEEGEDGM